MIWSEPKSARGTHGTVVVDLQPVSALLGRKVSTQLLSTGLGTGKSSIWMWAACLNRNSSKLSCLMLCWWYSLLSHSSVSPVLCGSSSRHKWTTASGFTVHIKLVDFSLSLITYQTHPISVLSEHSLNLQGTLPVTYSWLKESLYFWNTLYCWAV